MRLLLICAATMLPVAGTTQEAPKQLAPARGDHLSLAVADVDTSADFYIRIFGLRELPVPVAGPRWLDLGGGMALHLFPGRTAAIEDERRRHFALSVADFGALLERLEREKVAFTDFNGRPATIQQIRGDGVRQLFVQDPDGYWVEINDRMK